MRVPTWSPSLLRQPLDPPDPLATAIGELEYQLPRVHNPDAAYIEAERVLRTTATLGRPDLAAAAEVVNALHWLAVASALMRAARREQSVRSANLIVLPILMRRYASRIRALRRGVRIDWSASPSGVEWRASVGRVLLEVVRKEHDGDCYFSWTVSVPVDGTLDVYASGFAASLAEARIQATRRAMELI